jgi:3D-(3,5/4)-trihydroxycyclohexane-1,2-dione acylhydrolase (decyclizing)
VLTLNTDAYKWTPGGADWYVGVPEVSEREAVRKARATQEEFRKKQRQGI